jgi:hypothetical protein
MPFVEICRWRNGLACCGLRRGDIWRVGPVLPLWGEPRYVLRLASSEGEWRSGLVLPPDACAAVVSESHGRGAGAKIIALRWRFSHRRQNPKIGTKTSYLRKYWLS